MPLSGVINVFVKKEEFFISTSLTHLWAWKAHGYWAEDSDLCLPIGHLEVTFFLGVRGVREVKEVRDISIHYQEPDD